MKILIDIGHPAHVHLFKNFAWEMQKKGHDILFTCREKEFENFLLKKYRFQFKTLGKKYKSLIGKLWGIAEFSFKELYTGLKFKPDIFLSHGSIYSAIAAYILRKPHISLEDSGNMEQIRLYLPFTKAVITPDILPINLGLKQIRYSSYHELAYLHPAYFRPDKSVLKFYDINDCDKYALLRFVSWQATHDRRQQGFTEVEKSSVINYLLSQNIRVIISSEYKLPKEFKKFENTLSPDKIHDLIAFARLVISEGATIASESGILGTPTIYVNSITRCYNKDQEEKYGTVFNFRSGTGVLEKTKDLLLEEKLESQVNQNMLKEKIDLTAFLIWFIEAWPDSYQVMSKNPDYQYHFLMQ